MEKIIFIDRDGVINKDLWRYVEHWGEFEFIDGVFEALKLLHKNNFRIVIISNQAGIGDGKFTLADLDDINKNLSRVVSENGSSIFKTYYCTHGKQEGCKCRKPEIGLFLLAEEELPVFDKSTTYFIGDKVTDIEAGKRFGIKTILVKTGYGQKAILELNDNNQPDLLFDDLLSAVEQIVG